MEESEGTYTIGVNMTNEGRWPPKRCEMPDLSGEPDKKILGHVLNVFFRGAGPKDWQAPAFSRNFVRLCDLATHEYELARATLVEQVNTPNNVMSPLFRAVEHFEQCLSALQRAQRFARHKKGPKLPPSDVLSKIVTKRLFKIRNAIEHTDDCIRKCQISENEPIMLVVKSDSVELGGIEIYYNELAELIRALNKLAEFVAGYCESETKTKG